MRVGGGVVVVGWGGRSSLYVVRCTIPGICIMSGGPCDAAARRAGGKRQGEGSLLPLLSPNRLLTAHELLAGRHERGSAKERERERPCACLPCVRVDCTTASRSPFLQAAML